MRAFVSTLICTLTFAAAHPAVAEIRLLQEVSALCVANHADPTRVLAAADAAGWVHEPLALVGDDSPWWRVKPVAGGTFVLHATETTSDGPFGRVRTRTCIVETDAPGSPGLQKAIANLLGRLPQEHFGAVSNWIYQEKPDGRRAFISTDDAEATRRALASGAARVFWDVDIPRGQSIGYREGSLVVRADASASKAQ